jgi:peptidoglycan/LPS O-acetylase OafA/YrhL
MTSLSEAPLPATDKQLAHPKYRPDIDGLRAIAVLSVVAFHAFPSLIQGGFVGVDVFFVISGFLISSIIFGSLEKKSFSFVDFYTRRANRIFPALLLVLAATWGFGWFSLLADEYMQLGKHITGGAAFVSNFVLLGEAGYFDNSAETKLLLHLWSLGIEEQFYLVWPLMVWAAWKARINALILIVLVGSISFALNILNVHSDAVGTFYSPQTRFWELLVGSLLAYVTLHSNMQVWREGSGPMVRNIQSLAGLAFLIAAFALTTKMNQFPGWWALLPTVGAALIISAGPFAWFNRLILSSRLFVWFGLISFPLYLWHWPILTFAKLVTGKAPSIPVTISLVIASVILAWATYLIVEKPLQKINTRQKPMTLIALMAVISAIGFTTYKSNGFPTRFPTEIQELANFKYNAADGARVGKCWLDASAPYDGFSPECLVPSKMAASNRVLIWGDSHAGRFYAGLNAIAPKKHTILQATRDSCPPIIDYGYEVCKKSNLYVLNKIKNSKPDIVILFGAWGRYGIDWDENSEKQNKLLRTINQLKSLGVQRIIVFGPSPEWTDKLPNLAYRFWRQDFPLHRIPEKLATGLNPETLIVERAFERFVPAMGAKFFSVNRVLCDDAGCLVTTSENKLKLTSWDYGHLTTDGAIIVARKMLDEGFLQ